MLQAGPNVTLVGMDVTMTTLFTTAMMEEVAREGDDAAKELMRMTEFYVGAYKTMYPGIEGCGLHDPLAVAIAEDPEPCDNRARVRRRGVARAARRAARRSPTGCAPPSRCAMRRSLHERGPFAFHGGVSGARSRGAEVVRRSSRRGLSARPGRARLRVPRPACWRRHALL